MPWLTGNNAAAGTICRRVLIPADINLRAAVNGALTKLTEAHNWEQYGTLTPEQCADLMSAMYDAFLADDCDCPEESRMIGVITAFVTASAPTGCLECDGAQYLIADYPDLAAALDPAFIVSGTHFAVPDLRGRTIIGAGTGTGLTARAVGAAGGAETHQLAISEIPSHSHLINSMPNSSGGAANAFVRAANHMGGSNLTGNQGGGGAHNNMQPFVALKYAIVAVP